MRKFIYMLALSLALPGANAFTQANPQGSNSQGSQQSASPQAGNSQTSTQNPQSTQTSSQSDQDQDKDRDRDKDKNRHDDKDKKKHHDRDKDRDKDRDRNRDHDNDRDHDKDRDHDRDNQAVNNQNNNQQPNAQNNNQQLNADAKVKVQNILQQDPQIANNVMVNVTNNNELMLTGSVPTPEARQKAEQLARSAAGNQVVINQIQVANVSSSNTAAGAGGMAGAASNTPSATNTSQTAAIGSNAGGAQTSNSGVAMAVAPMSPGSSVCMQVSSNNQLLLTGNVPSPADKDRIQQLIQQSVGNQQVVNQIQTSNVNNRR